MRTLRYFLFTLFLFPALLSSQNTGPKVGLVLSGGGAKGFAQISVLKELEKAGVQLDYIGGTSIGAIVGGLYAAGYTAAQIESIGLTTDFYRLIRDQTPRKSTPFFEKENGEKHAFSLPIRNGILSLPQGLSKGQNTLNFLTELFSPVTHIKDFSELPIPFYCVATNIETGEGLVLERGSLPLSLRASSSYPSLLNPVVLGDNLLIDGGVANNFPTEIMRSKGMDIIIGVDVEGDLYTKEDITSVVAIMSQIMSYQMYANSKKQRAAVDVYVHPELSEYSVISFDKSAEIIAKGAVVAAKFRPVFDSIAKLQKPRKLREKMTPVTEQLLVDRIIIKGNKNYTRAYVLGALKLKEGDSVSYKRLSEKINNLSATDNFERIDYQFTPSFNGEKLAITVTENPVKANLRLGAHYDQLYKSGVLLNYYHKNILLKNDALSFDLVVGDNLRYNLDYFVDNGFLVSYGVTSRYNRFEDYFAYNSLQDTKSTVMYRDFSNSAHVQTTFDRSYVFGLGMTHKNMYVASEMLETPTQSTAVFDDSNYIIATSYIKLDTYDKKYFPTKGFYTDLSFQWYMWSDRNESLHNFTSTSQEFSQFSQAKGIMGFATSLSENLTFQYSSEAGFTLGKEPSQVFDFHLGGNNQNYINTFVSFYGYEIGALTEQTFLKSTFAFQYQFLDNHYAILTANYARVDDNVLKGVRLFDDIKSGYALGYSFDTFMGPIELKRTWSPETNQSYWLFNVGFWF